MQCPEWGAAHSSQLFELGCNVSRKEINGNLKTSIGREQSSLGSTLWQGLRYFLVMVKLVG